MGTDGSNNSNDNDNNSNSQLNSDNEEDDNDYDDEDAFFTSIIQQEFQSLEDQLQQELESDISDEDSLVSGTTVAGS